MKFGDEINGIVTDVDEKGRGIFFYDLPQAPGEQRTVVVPFTAPGDDIAATFVKRERGTWIGKLTETKRASADRVAAPCPHAGVCGGCLWQHLSYDAQLRMKREMITRAFARAGHAERIETVVPSPELFYFRNRMDYVFSWKGELGLKEYGSWNRYLDLSTCLLLDKETPEILKTIRELMRELQLLPWDAKRHAGDLRYAVIRLGKNTGERMITLIVHDLARFTDPIRAEITRRLAPFATTLYLGENPEITDLSLAKTFVLLHGKEFLTEEVNGLRYHIHPNSFFQTNTHMAGELQKVVLDFVGAGLAPAPGDHKGRPYRILDLYCGLGFFGIAAAKQGAMVYGHEIDAPAIELAKRNAKDNGVADRTEFGAGPVEQLDWADKHPDVVIVDPSRSGLHPNALQALIKNAPPQIVYVSCNYHRLAEELKLLKPAYRIERLAALDLFPHTPHVEVIAKLTKV